MPDSDITVSGLTAVAGIGIIELSWTVTNPNIGGLYYLDLRTVEVWASATNDRGAATKVREGDTVASHVLTSGLTRYYWIRAKNNSDLYGDWHPSSSTAGVSATSLSVDTIIAGTIKTAASGVRIELNPSTNAVESYSASGLIASLGANAQSLGVALVSNDGAVINKSGSGVAALNVGASSGLPGLSVSASGGGLAGNFQGAGTYGVLVTLSGGGSYGVFSQNTSGPWAFYAGGGAYGPFTGAHDGLIRKDVHCEPGDVLVGVRVVSKSGVSNVLMEVEPCSADAQNMVVGVAAMRLPIMGDTLFAAGAGTDPLAVSEQYDRVIFNAVGEGQVNVCGPVAAGDLLITSSVPGHAKRQADDIVRASTIGKAWESTSSEFAQIACVYHCG